MTSTSIFSGLTYISICSSRESKWVNGSLNPQKTLRVKAEKIKVRYKLKESKEKRPKMEGKIESRRQGGTGMEWQSDLYSQKFG